MGRRGLVERGLRIALKRHGGKIGTAGGGGKEGLSFRQNVEAARERLRESVRQGPGVFEVGAAIQLLTCFPEDSLPASRAAASLCTLLGSSTHLTPGPALSKTLKNSYLCSTSSQSSAVVWTPATFQGAWQWVQSGAKDKVKEWAEVGVAMEDVLELIRRARLNGNKLNRLGWSIHI